MSKRGQEQTSSEGSAFAKPKPMSPVQAKTERRKLVSQVCHSSSRWSDGSSSATALSNPEIPVKALTDLYNPSKTVSVLFAPKPSLN